LLQINRYAAGWQPEGSSEDAASWWIVDPDDFIPLVDISPLVDACPTRIPANGYPTTPPSPQYYLQY
jgi:hypothetical protein